MEIKKLITVCSVLALLLPLHLYSQIFQGKGIFKGKISSVDICDNGTPVSHDAEFTLGQKSGDSATGSQGARAKVRFDGEETEWRGPDTAIRTIDLSCFYTNADYGTDNANCGSRSEFSSVIYSTLIILPDFSKPLWNISLEISFSGDSFFNENVFIRVEAGGDNDDSKAITSLILPCDDQNAFSGDSPGEILDIAPGKYTLRIFQPDYAALNIKSDPMKHKGGKIYIKYKVMITGHD